MLMSVATHGNVAPDLVGIGVAPREMHRRISEVRVRFEKFPTAGDSDEESQRLRCSNGSYTRGSWERVGDAGR